MTIQIQNYPEPYSRAVDLYDEQYVPVRSRALDALQQQIERYVDDKLRGNSVLISGHRGSGKTTLISSAVTLVERKLRDRSPTGAPADRWPKRLLFVELHAPSLLRGGDQPPPQRDGAAAGPAGGKPAGAANSDRSVPAEIDRLTDEERLLAYLMINLHLTLMRAVTFAYRETIERLPASAVHSAALAEVAAEFTREMDDFPEPARLREYWQRAKVLSEGVLFWRQKIKFKDDTRYRRDQGLKELLLVASSVGFYKRVSSKLTTQAETEKKNDGDTQTSKSDSDFNLKNLILPLVGLISGGVVGGSAIALDSSGLQASLLAILSGFLAAWSLKHSSSRSHDHTVTRATQWERDLTVKTLRREIPRFIDRFIDAGVYPIILIDEVDKVRDIVDFDHVVQQLKVLFSERAFVCFAGDRNYYHRLLGETRGARYPKSATVYRQRLFVVYLPEDLLGFLSSVIP
jgi:hypothetical protein